MGKAKTSQNDIARMIALRKSGLSLDDIHKIVPQGKTTIFNYIRGVKVDFDLRRISSKRRSADEWAKTKIEATNLLGGFSKKSRLMVLAALYWGEGNKRELNLINSDPSLVRVFIECIKDIGVKGTDIKISLRLFNGIPHDVAKIFWSKITGVNAESIVVAEIIRGKKKGKLKYGMCRVRIRKSRYYFKLIMNMIDLIKQNIK